jgi:flagellar motor switch/type III secretory pathway protein FliN
MPLNGLIFSENLPQPKDFTLTVDANVMQTEMTVDELLAMPEPDDEDE